MSIAASIIGEVFGGGTGRSLVPDATSCVLSVHQGNGGIYTNKPWEYKGMLDGKELLTARSRERMEGQLVTTEKDCGTISQNLKVKKKGWRKHRGRGLFGSRRDFAIADEVTVVATGVKERFLVEPAALGQMEPNFDLFQQDKKGRTVVFVVTKVLTAERAVVQALKNGQLVCKLGDTSAGIAYHNSSTEIFEAANSSNPIILTRTTQRMAWDANRQPLQELCSTEVDAVAGPDLAADGARREQGGPGLPRSIVGPKKYGSSSLLRWVYALGSTLYRRAEVDVASSSNQSAPAWQDPIQEHAPTFPYELCVAPTPGQAAAPMAKACMI